MTRNASGETMYRTGIPPSLRLAGEAAYRSGRRLGNSMAATATMTMQTASGNNPLHLQAAESPRASPARANGPCGRRGPAVQSEAFFERQTLHRAREARHLVAADGDLVRERIRQLQEQALAKMRRALARRDLM